jgi:hypothetical protein
MSFPDPRASWRLNNGDGTETVSTSARSMTRFVAPESVTGGEFGRF